VLITFGGSGGSGGREDSRNFTDTELAAAAPARGVKTHPLSRHCQSPGGPPGLLLGYVASPVSVIEKGFALLGGALREVS
jgi:DNA-binding transcriptional MocR family regulator